jgi:chromosomal replication initiator protein
MKRPHDLHAPAILIAVSAEYGIPVAQILADDRRRHIARARHMAAYLMREWTDGSLAQIASTLNRGDHTTIVHAVNKMRAQRDAEMDERIGRIRTSLQEQAAAGWAA